jgi:hypothetical protein
MIAEIRRSQANGIRFSLLMRGCCASADRKSSLFRQICCSRVFDVIQTPPMRKPNSLNRWLIQTALLSLVLVIPILSAQTSDDSVAKLKQQIEQLKQENQQLREALAGNEVSPTPTRTASQTTASQDQQLTHWLTISSGKRHNSTCRWYHNSRGRPCRADEGTPCKICGG